MKDASWELQKAIYTVLAATGYSVWDKVGINTAYPYITITDFDMDNSTKGKKGQEFTFQVHCWTRYKGQLQAKAMKNTVMQAMTAATLTMTGFTAELILYTGTIMLEEPDNDVVHAVVSFKILTTEA